MRVGARRGASPAAEPSRSTFLRLRVASPLVVVRETPALGGGCFERPDLRRAGLRTERVVVARLGEFRLVVEAPWWCRTAGGILPA